MLRARQHVRAAAAALFAAALATAPAVAQSGDSVQQRVRRIFGSAEFAAQTFGPARWLPSGDAYTTVERAAGGGSDIVRYEAASGRRSVLVAATRLVPAGASEPLSVDDYGWSPDGTKLLLFTGSRRVWRDNTRGDYWVLEPRTGALRKLGGDAPPSTLMFAKFSPDGTRVAYVRQGDLYVERLADGQIVRLTSDGSAEVVNGTTDWVYEEEFGLRDAFRWSPDGTGIAYWRFDMRGVRDFLLINNTDSLYSFVTPIQYPKVGTTTSAVRAGVVSAAGGPTRWLDLPGDARNDYLPRMEWAAGSAELVLQRMNRPQNTNQVMLADAETGRTRTVLTERDSAWLDVVDDLHWLQGGRRFLWVSERDGWRHLYSVARDGSELRLLTPGAYDVVNVLSVDERGGWIYFIASPENPTQRFLYRVRLAGGAAERITPVAPGTHAYSISPNARWAIHWSSTFRTPSAVELVRLPSHGVERVLVDNTALRARVASEFPNRVEFFRVGVGGGVDLDGWMIFPRDFDPARSYPLLMHVYTEPWKQTVLDRWGGAEALWHRAIADAGYIVASVDNRGTPGPRGRAWRKAVYGAIGVLSSQEQAEAVRALTRERPYLDASRVGVWGWSGGGSATLNALFRYPDVYRMGMAVAPVADQRLYDAVYQERYVGLLADNPEGYRVGSPINFAEGLRGDLLIVHGTGDDNVHYQGTERLVNRLVELDKTFDFMSYPDRSHCLCEGEQMPLHLYQLMTRYLQTHLPAGPRQP